MSDLSDPTTWEPKQSTETEMDAVTEVHHRRKTDWHPGWPDRREEHHRHSWAGAERRSFRKDRRASTVTPAAEPSASERQEDGDHYTKLAIQPMAYSMANKLDPLQHSVVKYITRFRDKNGLVDLRKAIHCIELLIEHEYKKGEQ